MKGKRRKGEGYTTPGFLRCVENASDQSVGNVQLSRLNEAANWREHIGQEIQEWIRANAEAMFAGWVLECRRADREAVDEAASFIPSCQAEGQPVERRVS